MSTVFGTDKRIIQKLSTSLAAMTANVLMTSADFHNAPGVHCTHAVYTNMFEKRTTHPGHLLQRVLESRTAFHLDLVIFA